MRRGKRCEPLFFSFPSSFPWMTVIRQFFLFCGTRYAHWSERFNRVGPIILATIWLDKIHAQHWTYLILLKIVQADHFGWNGGRIHSLKTFAILPPVCSSKARMCTKMSQESLPPLLAIFLDIKDRLNRCWSRLICKCPHRKLPY